MCGTLSKMPQQGVPSIYGMPELPDVDPKEFTNVLYSIMGLLQIKIIEAMKISKLGVCPQIKPIDIFLMKNPYAFYEDIINEIEGLDALDKMEQLRSEVKLKIPGF